MLSYETFVELLAGVVLFSAGVDGCSTGLVELSPGVVDVLSVGVEVEFSAEDV